LDLYKKINKFKKFVLPALIIVLLTAIVYGQTLNHDFVNFDDDGYVYNNYHIRSGFNAESVIYAFTTMDKGNWIPLTWLSHLIDIHFFGLMPAGHHFTNLLFHCLNALLLFIFLTINTRHRWLSFCVAILFAVHPLHVESVAWISERKDVLSTFFGLLTLISYCAYSRKQNIKNYFLTFFFFLLGLLSKPMIVTFPILFFLLDYWPLQRVSPLRKHSYFKPDRMLIIEKIPFLLICLVFSSIAILSQQAGNAMASSAEIPFFFRLMNALVSYTIYIIKTLWPYQLAVIYPYQHTLNIFHVVMSGLFLLAVSVVAIVYSKKHPYLLFGWGWFLITLLPVIGLIQVGSQAMADRYTYIPIIGLFISIIWLIYNLMIKFRLNRDLLILTFTIITLSYCMLTLNQLKTWKNSDTLFTHALAVTENNWLAHLNLGEDLFANGKIDDAIAHYTKALEINPSFELAYLNLGTAFAKKGQIDDSIRYYHQALEMKKNMPAAWLNLGNAYFRKGMLKKALLHYDKALELKPDYPNAYCGIGAVMAKKGDLLRATRAFKKALEIDPGSHSALEKLKQIEKYTIQVRGRSSVPR